MRHYDPTYGRFMSVDPLWAKYAPLQPYHYAGNEPIARYDLFGFGVAEVNALAKRVDPELKRLYNEALRVLKSTSRYFEFSAAITSTTDGGAHVGLVQWQEGREIGAQVTTTGQWGAPALPGLLGSAHSHSMPTEEGGNELWDGIPPSIKDFIAIGKTAQHLGCDADGHVGFTYAGSVNFAIEVSDPTAAAAFFANEENMKLINEIFDRADSVEKLREAMVKLNEIKGQTGIVIYESNRDEIDYNEVGAKE